VLRALQPGLTQPAAQQVSTRKVRRASARQGLGPVVPAATVSTRHSIGAQTPAHVRIRRDPLQHRAHFGATCTWNLWHRRPVSAYNPERPK